VAGGAFTIARARRWKGQVRRVQTSCDLVSFCTKALREIVWNPIKEVAKIPP
ncbi:hypothetical protein BaRGS_00008283, partial [Batillaria attramentaria]